MGKIGKHPPVKLIIGFIFKNETILEKAKTNLVKLFGKIDFESQIISFTHTDYYERELGKCLKRSFISFVRLIPPEKLPKIKIQTNAIEQKLASAKVGARLINIDPGYLDLAKLVLASTKDYRHRLYLGNGIYAEVTLFYQGKTFEPWEWTYPDYRTKDYITVFNNIRQIYRAQIAHALAKP